MKVDFGITYNNGDTQHNHREDIFVESDNPEFVNFAESIKGAQSSTQALRLLQNYMQKGSFLYEKLIEIFEWRGHNKLDWDDVMVSFVHIAVGGVGFDINDQTVKADTFYNVSTLQLEHGSPVHMYFIEEF